MWLYLRDFVSLSAMYKAARIYKSTGDRVFLFMGSDLDVKEFEYGKG